MDATKKKFLAEHGFLSVDTHELKELLEIDSQVSNLHINLGRVQAFFMADIRSKKAIIQIENDTRELLSIRKPDSERTHLFTASLDDMTDIFVKFYESGAIEIISTLSDNNTVSISYE